MKMTDLEIVIGIYEHRLAEWEPQEKVAEILAALKLAAQVCGVTEKDEPTKKPRAKTHPACTLCGVAYSRHRGEKRTCPKHPDSEWRP